MTVPLHFGTVLNELFKYESVTQVYEKGDFLIREGEVEAHLYFIESGAVRVLLLTEFEEHTIRIGYKGSVINSLSSYLRQAPSEFFIEVLRKTSVKKITRSAIEQVIQNDAASAMAYTRMLEELVTQQIDREIDILTGIPKTRLDRVLKRSPDLFQEVPLKYIASYLRMTPETLSRLRNS